MKLLIFILFSTNLYSQPSIERCFQYLQSNLPNFNSCLESTLRSCGQDVSCYETNNPFSSTITTDKKEALNNKYIEIAQGLKKCTQPNSPLECPSGTGCYKSGVDEIFDDSNPHSELYTDLLTNIRGLAGNKLKVSGATCDFDLQCQSMKCESVSGSSSNLKKCRGVDLFFCRKAKLDENAKSDQINCEEGLTKDNNGFCQNESYHQQVSKDTIDMIMSLNFANVCKSEDNSADSPNALYKSLPELNTFVRGFELLFSNSVAKDQFHIQPELKKVADRIRSQRIVALKKLDQKLQTFHQNFITLKAAKNTETEITFRGETFKSSDLFEQSVKNRHHLLLLTDLENAQKEYNQEMALLLKEAYEKIESFNQDYNKEVKENDKDFKFANKRSLYSLKNKNRWRYRVSLTGNEYYKFITDSYNSGKIKSDLVKIFGGVEQANELFRIDARTYFYQFPLAEDQRLISKLNLGRTQLKRIKEGKELQGKLTNLDKITKNLNEINSKNFVEDYTNIIVEKFNKLLSEDKDLFSYDYVDFDFNIKKSCLNQSENENCFERVQKIEKDIASSAMAQLFAFSGNGKNKSLKGGFLGGQQVGSTEREQELSNGSKTNTWEKFTPHGKRGHYFRYLLERLNSLSVNYLKISELNMHRADCYCTTPECRAGNTGNSAFYTSSSFSPSLGGSYAVRNSALGNGAYGSRDLSKPSNKPYTKKPAGNSLSKKSKNTSQSLDNIAETSSAQLQTTTGTSTTSKNSPPQSNSTKLNSSDYSIKVERIIKEPNSFTQEQSFDDYDDYNLYGSNGNDESSRSIANTNLDPVEKKHILRNLNNFKVPRRTEGSIFQKISENYVEIAYPQIFAD